MSGQEPTHKLAQIMWDESWTCMQTLLDMRTHTYMHACICMLTCKRRSARTSHVLRRPVHGTQSPGLLQYSCPIHGR